ncbi:MAG: hypothetical protein Kow0068_09060 [Marinilabiliales bacterium]
MSLMSFMAYSQVYTSSFESWTGGVPDGWMGSKTSIEADSVNQITSGTQYGSNAVQLVNTESSHKRFTTQPLQVDAGVSYEITFWVKGNGQIRTAVYDTTYGAYNSYISVNSSTWTSYSQTVTAANTSATGEFIISVANTVAPDHIQLDYVAIVVTSVPTVPIHDIQYTTNTNGDSPYNGQTVKTGGIVTAVTSYGRFFIQSGQGAWNGIYVYDNNNQVSVGDSVIFTAMVSEYNGLTELSGLAAFQTVSSGNSLYSPVTVTTGEMSGNGEPYEGVLIDINNATCTNANAGYGMWTINDGSGALNVDDDIYAYTPVANEHYDVTGVGHYSYGEFKILPRSASDVNISSGINTVDNNEIINVYPNPANEYVEFQSNDNIIKLDVYNIAGELIYSYELSKVNKSKIDISDLDAGVYMLQFSFENDKKASCKITKQ